MFAVKRRGRILLGMVVTVAVADIDWPLKWQIEVEKWLRALQYRGVYVINRAPVMVIACPIGHPPSASYAIRSCWWAGINPCLCAWKHTF